MIDTIELIETANLSPETTRVEGVVRASTARGSHGPRIKWYPGRPAANAPCLSVLIERRALLEFWTDGTTWMDEEVTAFKQALKRLA